MLGFQVLGFENYVSEVEEVLKDHKQQVKVSSGLNQDYTPTHLFPESREESVFARTVRLNRGRTS